MALTEIVQTSVALIIALTLSQAVRRLFLHPLSHIPGPRLAALTWWYEFYYDGVQGGKYVFKIQELHRKYGPIIRVTPDEIHINDVGFLDTVYAPATTLRDKYEYQLRSLRVPGGVGTTARHDTHKKRREALVPFFSKRNVTFHEPLIRKKLDQLLALIRKHAMEKTPVNLSDAFFGFTNDVVTNFLFAYQVNVLGDEAEAAKLRHNSYQLLQGINMNKHFPWIPDFLDSLPLSVSKPIMPPGLVDLLSLFDRVRAELTQIMSKKNKSSVGENPVGPTGKESVYDSVLDCSTLPPSEKSLLRLEQEGALLVLAGTESPAQSLKMIFYYLLANPLTLQKLQDELRSIPAGASWTELEQLPYLAAVVEEGNRLSWGVTARLARIAHEPLTYTPSRHVAGPVGSKRSYTIPAGTPISITTLSAHTADSVFPEPFKFSPERWLGEEGKDRRRYQMAFGKGSRKCLGIELARAELFMATASLIKAFDMELWHTDHTDVAFLHDFQVAMPRLDSKGLQVKASLRNES